MSFGILSFQICRNLSKLKVAIGSFILDAKFTKKNEFISNVFLIFDDTVIDLRGGGGGFSLFLRVHLFP